jgi:hypothetical protein
MNQLPGWMILGRQHTALLRSSSFPESLSPFYPSLSFCSWVGGGGGVKAEWHRPDCLWRPQVTRKSGSRRWMLFAGLAAVVTLVAAAAFFPHTVSGEKVEAGCARGEGGRGEREGEERGETQ